VKAEAERPRKSIYFRVKFELFSRERAKRKLVSVNKKFVGAPNDLDYGMRDTIDEPKQVYGVC
jgi:hypothetical protein